MKFYCKLPEDGDNAETYGILVVEKNMECIIVGLFVFPNICGKIIIILILDLRSSEVLRSA
jgi:hypothetical protein